MKDFLKELQRRLGPFLALLDARYLPLLFAIAPQAYAVYVWLYDPARPGSEWVAVMGALGYEMIYVGAIAWAEHAGKTIWTQITAATALVFSVAVAIYVYRHQGYWALLHAGFPVVAFCYTMQMHAGKGVPAAAPSVPSAEFMAHAMAQLTEHLARLEPRIVPGEPRELTDGELQRLFDLVPWPVEPIHDNNVMELARSLREQGKSLRHVAQEVGIPPTTLRRKLSQNGSEAHE